MDRHRALQLRGGGAHAHHVDDAVDGFVAVGSEDRGAEDRLRSGIDDDLHESLRLVLLHRAPDPPHRPLAHHVPLPALAPPGLPPPPPPHPPAPPPPPPPP